VVFFFNPFPYCLVLYIYVLVGFLSSADLEQFYCLSPISPYAVAVVKQDK